MFSSYFLGGFECSTKRRNDGRRLDVLAATGHDVHAASDYAQLQEHGIHAVRDGIRWHRVEHTPCVFDWSSVTGMARAARRTGTQVIWDLCHYGWPDHVDIWSDAFPHSFARFAAAAAVHLSEILDEPPWFCPINEMSFVAWAAGDMARFHPSAMGRGFELKRQLARAVIAAVGAIRRVVPKARFICAEPLIRVLPGADYARTVDTANGYTRAQFDALDMVLGRLLPELGGDPSFVDVVGTNFYPDNQWTVDGYTLWFGHHDFRPLHDMLLEVWNRYNKPILVSETSAEGNARAPWLHYVAQETLLARSFGIDVRGVCLYPVLDYPGWENDRPCPVGLMTGFGIHTPRAIHRQLAEELKRQMSAVDAAEQRSAIAI